MGLQVKNSLITFAGCTRISNESTLRKNGLLEGKCWLWSCASLNIQLGQIICCLGGQSRWLVYEFFFLLGNISSCFSYFFTNFHGFPFTCRLCLLEGKFIRNWYLPAQCFLYENVQSKQHIVEVMNCELFLLKHFFLADNKHQRSLEGYVQGGWADICLVHYCSHLQA